jgi:siroheme synthase
MRFLPVCLDLHAGVVTLVGSGELARNKLWQRGKALRVTTVTAQQAAIAESIDWSGLADVRTTVVVYMGLAAAKSVRDGPALLVVGEVVAHSTPWLIAKAKRARETVRDAA